MKILIVEDEKELNRSISDYLSREGYICEAAHSYLEGLSKTEQFDYDCILLDITLPGGNGLRILQELKANSNADGVIIISAKDSIDDRIAGLNLGADDYLAKPFHLSELSARVAALIRRRRFHGNKVIVANEITVDLGAKTVLVLNELLELTRKEYILLLYLISNKNRVVSRNALAEHLSGDLCDSFHNLDFVYTHIKNLKRKLHVAGCQDYIRSIYGMGYKFQI